MNTRSPRYVLHADFDTFYVSVERVCNPSLRGRPVVIGGMPIASAGDSRGNGNNRLARGVVMAVSHEARVFGVRSMMSVEHAVKLCRDLVVVQGNDRLYQRASHAVFGHLRQYSPNCETASVDEAYLDLTGMQRLFGAAVDVGARLRREITERFRLALTVGVASNKLVSKVASDSAKPGGLYDVRPGDESAFLAPLPVIRLPGVGTQTSRRLGDFNIELIRELAQTDRLFLQQVFGRRGEVLHAHAQGLDDSPVGGTQKPRVIAHEETLLNDSNDRELLSGVMFRCVETVGYRLRTHRLMARRITAHVRYVDGIVTSASSITDDSTDLDREISIIAEGLLKRVLTRRLAVRQIGIRLGQLSAFDPQLGLFCDEGRGYERKRSLMSAIDRIRKMHGDDGVVWGRVVGRG